MPTRVAVVISHPIQHFCPQYASWARLPGVELRVFFASKHGLDEYRDEGFGRAVRWEGLKLDFPHEFLEGAAGRAVDNAIDAADLDGRLDAFGPQALIVYGYAQRLQRRAKRWGRRRAVPVLMIADSEMRSPRTLPTRMAKAIVVPRLLKDVALFLTVGDSNEAYYRHYGVPEQRLVRNFFPIDVELYDRQMPQREELRRRVRAAHGVGDDQKLLLMVGKLVPWKRQGDLVALARHAAAQDWVVVMAGTGPDEGALRAAAEGAGPGRVAFAGFVPPAQLPAHYFAADLYVHCSTREPHSLAISEAIYCGLPAVISDQCGSYGPTDDVRPGVNGGVYRCGNVPHMARTILDTFAADFTGMREASARIGKEHQRLAHGAGLQRALAQLSP